MIRRTIHINSQDVYKLCELHTVVKDEYEYNSLNPGSWNEPVYYMVIVPQLDDLRLLLDLMHSAGIRIINNNVFNET